MMIEKVRVSLALVIAITILTSPFAARAADAAKYDLGGPRQVKAEVTVADDEYRIHVSMRPVRVFDKVTNAEVNREKARQYALQALGKHLSNEKIVEFSVSGATVAKAEADGDRYVLALRVPRSGVRFAGKEDPASPQGERVRFSDAFLRAKLDHENTARQLAERAAAALKKIEAKSIDREELASALDELLKESAIQYDKLAEEIKGDLLLSSVAAFGKPSEKDELLELVTKNNKELKTLAAAAIARFKPKNAKEPG